ncbi:hypothetical protein [Streptosporangium carneum]|uniref:Secreted protein n=1 Tax=Streptosporangium carneum TaxID=47481 RepID=A0A9W6MG01_9ACTN|nr:hypothetical protein [Streptosporangium carneum]GLK12595.1 hypothetical protein GCM10017600_60050 [Streptosporangium carneum]
MPVLRRLAGMAASVIVGAALFTAPAAHAAQPPANAPAELEGCWGAGPTVTDTLGVQWPTRYCNNFLAGDVYNYVDGRWQPIGRLNAGNSWFVCQSHGPENPAVGEWLNDIWLYTEADVVWAAGGWGGFPATHVSGGENYEPIPNLDWCPWENTLARRSVPTTPGK